MCHPKPDFYLLFNIKIHIFAITNLIFISYSILNDICLTHDGRYFGLPGKYVCASALTQAEDKGYFQLVHNHHKLLAQLLHIHIDTCFQSFRNGGESWFPKIRKINQRMSLSFHISLAILRKSNLLHIFSKLILNHCF